MTDFAEPTELADIALARSIAGGDEAAFDRLYGEHVARVHAVCLRMAGDGARARSLTQEAFVRAWQRIGSFRGDSRLSTWLHRIAVNVVIEDARSRKRWRERLVAPEHGTGRAAVGDDPALRVDLERAIARLPPGARRMLVLRDVEGHSYDEVAELTGVSIGTVKSQISRARRLVRDMLEA
ncbi:MAG TPA: sigma-70 family RNA polymerase sigma factor [Longimicrobiales bacterium]